MNERTDRALSARMPPPRAWRGAAALLGAAVWIAVLGLPSSAGAVPVPAKNCGAAGDLIAMQQFDASLWPPVAGKPITLTLKWTLAEDLAWGGHEVLGVTLPSGFQFPVLLPLWPQKAGPHVLSTSFSVPTWLAGQIFGLHIVEYDRTGNRLVCLDATIPIK